jgi:competence ComEA-like helix-hairpin-helix protein
VKAEKGYKFIKTAPAALICGTILMAWQIMDIASNLPKPPPKPLSAACENGRMTLTSTEKPGKEGNAACQPFVSPLIAVNQANAGALAVVPGIGAATAAKIIAYRKQHGPFHSVVDLERVPGIGRAKAARFAEYLSFE